MLYYNLSPHLKIRELETIETLPYEYKRVIIPLTYVPIHSAQADKKKTWRWRVFIGNRFCGEYSLWSWTSYTERPMLSYHFNRKDLRWRTSPFEAKKVSRALNILQFGSARYKPEILIRVIKEHCGVDATVNHTPRRR